MPDHTFTADEEAKIIKYLWIKKILQGPSIDQIYNQIIQAPKSMYDFLLDNGLDNPLDKINEILNFDAPLKYDYGIENEIRKLRQKHSNHDFGPIGENPNNTLAEITDIILTFLLNNDAVKHRTSDTKNKFVSIQQLTFFLLEKYGLDLVTPDRLNISLAILDECGEISISDKGVQLSKGMEMEAEWIRDSDIICDWQPTSSRPQILSHVLNPKTAEEVLLCSELIKFYEGVSVRNLVRIISSCNCESFDELKEIKIIEEAMYEEALFWKFFENNILKFWFLYAEYSVLDEFAKEDFTNLLEAKIKKIYELSNRPGLPPTDDNSQIGNSVIQEIAELKELSFDEIETKSGSSDAFISHLDLLTLKVENFEISDQSINCLRNAGINLAYDLVQWTEQELLNIENFGPESLDEIKDILHHTIFLKLGMKF